MGIQQLTPSLGIYHSFPNYIDPRCYRAAPMSTPRFGTVITYGATGTNFTYLAPGATHNRLLENTPGWEKVRDGFVLWCELGVQGSALQALGVWINGGFRLSMLASCPLIHSVYAPEFDMYLYNGTGDHVWYNATLVYLPREYYMPDIGAQTDTPMERGK